MRILASILLLLIAIAAVTVALLGRRDVEKATGIRSVFGLLPRTRLSWWALALLAVFVVLFETRFVLHLGRSGVATPGGGGFFDDPWMAAVLSGGLAAFAIGFRRERSPRAFLAAAIGLFVLAFSVAEIVGGGH